MASHPDPNSTDKETRPKEEEERKTPTGDAASDETKDKFECDDATCRLPGHGHGGEQSPGGSRRENREHRRIDRQSSRKSLSGDQEGQALRRRSSSGRYYDVIFRCRSDMQWYSTVRRRSAINRLIHDGESASGDSEGKGEGEGKYFKLGFPMVVYFMSTCFVMVPFVSLF